MILSPDTDCRDMEPSTGTERYWSKNKRIINSYSTVAFLLIAGVSMPVCSLRIRGGTDEDEVTEGEGANEQGERESGDDGDRSTLALPELPSPSGDFWAT